MEIWKRRQNEIAHMWNTSKTSLKDDVERSEFKADYIIDTEYNKVKKKNTVFSNVRRIFGEIPIVSISIAIVVVCFIWN